LKALSSMAFLFREMSLVEGTTKKAFRLIPIGAIHSPFKRMEELPFHTVTESLSMIADHTKESLLFNIEGF
jgi:hypothetical protein